MSAWRGRRPCARAPEPAPSASVAPEPAASAGLFDFLDSKSFAAATVAAITAVVCFVSGFGGEIGMLVISPLMALVYWLIFR